MGYLLGKRASSSNISSTKSSGEIVVKRKPVSNKKISYLFPTEPYGFYTPPFVKFKFYSKTQDFQDLANVVDTLRRRSYRRDVSSRGFRNASCERWYCRHDRRYHLTGIRARFHRTIVYDSRPTAPKEPSFYNLIVNAPLRDRK